MKHPDNTTPFITAIESIINTQKKDFQKSSLLLSNMVLCDSEDLDRIEFLRHDTEQ